MIFVCLRRSILCHRCPILCLRYPILAVLLASLAGACALAQTDISGQFLWQPVRIGGGGWVVGMVLHPLDPAVRYARTDVGSPYRWDNSGQQWVPMRVLNSDGSGIQSSADTS